MKVVLTMLVPMLTNLARFVDIGLRPRPTKSSGSGPVTDSVGAVACAVPLVSMFVKFALPTNLNLC